MSEPIRSAGNARLRKARALRTRRARRKLGCFLLEGPKVIDELLAHRPQAVEQLLFREGAETGAVGATIARARGLGLPCLAVAPKLYAPLAPADSAQPVLAIAHQRWAEPAELFGPPPAAAEEAAPRALVASAGLQDPGNLGTVLRTAHYLGFSGAAFLPGTHDPWSPKVVRSSAGALCALPLLRSEGEALLAAAATHDLVPVALAAHGGEPLAELPARALVILGAEGQGLPPELEARVPRRLSIASRAAPGATGAESLNVAVAFGIAAHAWSQRWTGPQAADA